MFLAIDTSTNAGSVALCDESGTFGELFLDAQVRSTRTLVPAIEELLQRNNVSFEQLLGIGIVIGPGSFTGLRIGVTTAKMLAWATKLRLIPVLATDVLAEQAQSELTTERDQLEIVIDAQRGELFTARYKLLPDNGLRLIRELAIQPYDTWLQELKNNEIVTGPILERLAKKLPEMVRLSSPETWSIRAACVGKIAMRHFKSGISSDPLEVKPLYIRPSYAEEATARKQA
jgi:tRNA threonylcarbamoyladenosine biosynthesis protein TsaB